MMKQRSLINQLMMRFAAFMVVLLVVSAPLFYFIVTDFYTEDLREAALAAGIPRAELDLEADTIMGLVIQVMAIVVILGLSIFLIMRLVPAKLWRPFHSTLDVLSRFKVEDGHAPVFGRTDTKELAQLNDTLTRISLNGSIKVAPSARAAVSDWPSSRASATTMVGPWPTRGARDSTLSASISTKNTIKQHPTHNRNTRVTLWQQRLHTFAPRKARTGDAYI